MNRPTRPAALPSPAMSTKVTYYLLICRECDPKLQLPMPFESAEARGKWAAAHTGGTGHDRWWMYGQEWEEPDHVAPPPEKHAADLRNGGDGAY